MVPVILSMVATIAFAVLYQIPKRAIVPVGLLGGVAWLFDSAALRYGVHQVAASFVASLIVSLCSEAFARKLKMPVTVFAVPAIVVLVPGITAFMAMKSFVMGAFIEGMAQGTQTALVAGALASGLVISGVLYRTLGRRRPHADDRSRA